MTDCKPCSPGKYCDPNAGVVQERDCDPGFVCLIGELKDSRISSSDNHSTNVA
jgi:hypothetical protein